MSETLSELSRFLEGQGLSCRIEGDGSTEIRAANTLEEAGAGDISFLANRRYSKHLHSTQASAVVVGMDEPRPDGMALLRCTDPYAAIALLIVKLHGYRHHAEVGVSEGASVHPSARIGSEANIHPNVTIAEDVVIGDRCRIYPGCYVGPRCRIGDDLLLMPNVVVYDDCVLGDRVAIHAGTVIGNDGLGYAPVGETWQKIPQAGFVEIGNDVEIGTNCSIDRATLGKTMIGSGTKMSNLIAIGHGTKIGENCMLVAQAGVAGSVVVGKHVTLAGQVGVVGHITIGDNASVGAKAGVAGDIKPGSAVLGQPAIPIRQKRREIAILGKLPGIWKQLKDLPKRVKAIEAKLADLAPDASDVSGADPHPRPDDRRRQATDGES